MFAPDIWIDKYGKVYRISYMDTNYLKNVLNLLLKWANKAREIGAIDLLWVIERKIDEIEDELMKRNKL